jgi:clan AA aspartic protease (TIGR02281 family)
MPSGRGGTLRILRSVELTKDKVALPGLLIFVAAFVFAAQAAASEIPLRKYGGIYTLPVRINGAVTLNFILDSGASEVTISADVANTLLRTGIISKEDFLPGWKYRLADGSTLSGSRFKIRELELGGVKIPNVTATVVPATGAHLLGQSFLSRIPHWSIDNERHLLVISDLKTTESSSPSEELKYDPSRSLDPPKPFPNDPDAIDPMPQSTNYLPDSGKIPPSRSVNRTPEGKILPSR